MNFDLEALEQGATISLWQIDLTTLSGKNEWFYFCNQLNEKKDPFIIWNGKKYNSLPVDINGVSRSSTGVSGRPTLSIGNIDGLFTGLISQFGGLIGADVVRFVVPVNSLDSDNFIDGNTEADASEYLAQRFIVQSSKESPTVGQLELSWITELENVIAPTKQMFANVCAWQYRSIECGYKGGAVADSNDIATNDIAQDDCSKSLLGCKARWGENAVLPALMFVGIDKL